MTVLIGGGKVPSPIVGEGLGEGIFLKDCNNLVS